jgi:hypothetical protein
MKYLSRAEKLQIATDPRNRSRASMNKHITKLEFTSRLISFFNLCQVANYCFPEQPRPSGNLILRDPELLLSLL